MKQGVEYSIAVTGKNGAWEALISLLNSSLPLGHKNQKMTILMTQL